jgi:hypothetical protein
MKKQTFISQKRMTTSILVKVGGSPVLSWKNSNKDCETDVPYLKKN